MHCAEKLRQRRDIPVPVTHLPRFMHAELLFHCQCASPICSFAQTTSNLCCRYRASAVQNILGATSQTLSTPEWHTRVFPIQINCRPWVSYLPRQVRAGCPRTPGCVDVQLPSRKRKVPSSVQGRFCVKTTSLAPEVKCGSEVMYHSQSHERLGDATPGLSIPI